MAEKKPDTEMPADRPPDVAAVEANLRDTDDAMADEQRSHLAMLDAIAIEDDPEARASAAKMNTNIAKAQERHQDTMDTLAERREKALAARDTDRTVTKVWKGMVRVQCAFCYRDFMSDERGMRRMQIHQSDKHSGPLATLGPKRMDRRGMPIVPERED